MKTIAIAIVSLLTLNGSCAAFNRGNTRITPSGTNTTRTVGVRAFDAIEASRVKVVYTPGPATGTVTVTAPDNLMQYVVIEVDDGTLECGISNRVQLIGSNDTCVTVTVTASAANDFKAVANGMIEVNGDLTVNELEASASTNGSVVLGNVTAHDDADLEVTTNGVVKILNLVTGSADISATTNATVSVNEVRAEEIDADATTNGRINISGGTVSEVEYVAATGGNIDASAVTAGTGSATATTGGSIDCKIRRAVSISSNTGGSVNNNPV